MAIRSRIIALLIPLAVIACNAPPSATDVRSQEASAKKDSWERVMAQVEDDRDVVDKLLNSDPQGDLDQVANAAEQAARLMRSGYGKHEQKQVENFANMARECESWLLKVAMEARQGHGELALAAFQAGRSNCTKCHDAAGVRW